MWRQVGIQPALQPTFLIPLRFTMANEKSSSLFSIPFIHYLLKFFHCFFPFHSDSKPFAIHADKIFRMSQYYTVAETIKIKIPCLFRICQLEAEKIRHAVCRLTLVFPQKMFEVSFDAGMFCNTHGGSFHLQGTFSLFQWLMR